MKRIGELDGASERAREIKREKESALNIERTVHKAAYKGQGAENSNAFFYKYTISTCSMCYKYPRVIWEQFII